MASSSEGSGARRTKCDVSSRCSAKPRALGSLSPGTLSTGSWCPQETFGCLRRRPWACLLSPQWTSPGSGPAFLGSYLSQGRCPELVCPLGPERGHSPETQAGAADRPEEAGALSLPPSPHSPSPLPPSSHPLFLPLSSDHPALCSPPPWSSVCLKGQSLSTTPSRSPLRSTPLSYEIERGKKKKNTPMLTTQQKTEFPAFYRFQHFQSALSHLIRSARSLRPGTLGAALENRSCNIPAEALPHPACLPSLLFPKKQPTGLAPPSTGNSV